MLKNLKQTINDKIAPYVAAYQRYKYYTIVFWKYFMIFMTYVFDIVLYVCERAKLWFYADFDEFYDGGRVYCVGAPHREGYEMSEDYVPFVAIIIAHFYIWC